MKRILGLLLGTVLLFLSGCARQPSKVTQGVLSTGPNDSPKDSQIIRLYAGPVKPQIPLGDSQDGSYSVSSTRVRIEIPRQFSPEAPIRMADSNGFLELLPLEGTAAGQAHSQANCFGQQRESVWFESLLGEGIRYSITPLEWGVNTEILLPDKEGKHTFQMKLNVPSGWEADERSKEVLVFRDRQDISRVQGMVYAPLAVDANGRWNGQTGVELAESDPENGVYTIEYTVSEEFLQDPKTRYPVTLHQSAGLYVSKQADTCVHEKGETSYLSPCLTLGDAGGMGDSKALIRFDSLQELDLDPDSIQSAKYIVRNLFDLPQKVKLSAYAVTENWSSPNANWDNCPAYDQAPVGEVLIQGKGEYALDITTLVREMVKNKRFENTKYAVSKGFLLHCETPGANVLLASGDNGLYSPCLELEIKK